MTYQTVTDGRTLRALERKGFIREPDSTFRPKGKAWGRAYHYVERAVVNSTSWTWKGSTYYLAYVEGCLFPIVKKVIY